jgi:hypothetical protein
MSLSDVIAQNGGTRVHFRHPRDYHSPSASSVLPYLLLRLSRLELMYVSHTRTKSLQHPALLTVSA